MKKLTIGKRKRLTGYVFLSPWIFSSVFLLFFPITYSLLLSFSESVAAGSFSLRFIGLEHYREALLADNDFIYSFLYVLKETVVKTPVILVFSLIIAIILSRNIKGRGFFRSVFFLPVLLGSGYVMRQLLGQGIDQSAMDMARGILLPQMLQEYLGPKISDMISSFLSIITIVMWKSGVQIVIFLAGIQKIPASLYESARVDSATEWEMFWKITLPMISPIILLNIVYTVISSFGGDSPMVDYLKYRGFSLGESEYAAAMGWIYFAFVLVTVGLVFLFMRRFIKEAE